MSSVQFNLLPSSKYKTIAAEGQQKQIVNKALLVALGCFGLFALLFIYTDVVQKTQISSANNSISAKSAKLKAVPNINTILTIENQLTTAATLHASQHDTSRIFGYLTKLTPPNASINSLSLDMTKKIISISGSADSASTVNAFVDTLKYTQYKVGSAAAASAFTAVIESNFSITQSGVSYTINANFAPKLFANNMTDSNGKLIAPQLVVPNATNTRSTNDPGSLFGGH